MSDLAIRAVQLSKQYRIGAEKYRHNTLRDQLADGVKSLFRLRNRRKREKNTIWALKDVSFEVKQGEVLGIIGLNGAGKSTLLKLLSRITEPTEGRAEIYGRIGSLLEVGTGFSFELTGRENIYLNGAILGMKKAEIDRKFDEIVEFSELEKFLETPLKHYSSGMYVRLAFAVAAHLDPDILLIDEVLSVGDLSFQRKCMRHAKRLQERKATVLVVSHNMFSIKALCERVIYLSQGRIRVDGSPAEAIDLYERESRLSIAPWADRVVGSAPNREAIHVTDLQLLDEGGVPRAVFDYGERMRVRIRFNALERILGPNFNVSFIRSDNVACCNYNTAMDGVTISSVFGGGAIELLTPPLKLTAELYTAHVMVWDVKFERLYSAQVGGTFHVRHDVLNTHFGVFHESAEWLGVTEESEISPMNIVGGGKGL